MKAVSAGIEKTDGTYVGVGSSVVRFNLNLHQDSTYSTNTNNFLITMMITLMI